MKGALVFIDGTICDDRHRLGLFGTNGFYLPANVLADKPVAGSVTFINELAATYSVYYAGARPADLSAITKKWLSINGFPDGDVYLAPTQAERLRMAEGDLSDKKIVLGIGDRWDDNQLHLTLGCLSIIVKEYEGDWDFVRHILKRGTEI